MLEKAKYEALSQAFELLAMTDQCYVKPLGELVRHIGNPNNRT
jgi:hypothetical protein